MMFLFFIVGLEMFHDFKAQIAESFWMLFLFGETRYPKMAFLRLQVSDSYRKFTQIYGNS